MTEQRDNFRLAWNIGAAHAVLLPFLLWFVAFLVKGGDDREEEEEEGQSSWWSWGNNNNDDGDDDGNNNNGGNDENSGGWWFWGNNGEEMRREDQQGRGAIVFVYLWSLLVFGLLVWYGNVVFRKNAHPLPLLSAMVVFWNMCFMCLILVCSLGVSGV